MNTNEIIEMLDGEIARLQSARALLGGTELTPKRGPGRPKGSGTSPKPPAPKRQPMSSAARAKIAAAQRARWAKQKAPAKLVPKKAAPAKSAKNGSAPPTKKGVAAPARKTAPAKKASASNSETPATA